MKRRVQVLLAAGGALLLLVNIIVLSGVAWNRSGEPEAMLRLSERELGLPSMWRDREENSGLALSLRWRVVPNERDDGEQDRHEHSAYSSVHWLDAERLSALGFDVQERTGANERHRYHGLAREVWLALELDGPAHAQSVQRAEEALSRAEQALAIRPSSAEHQKLVHEAKQRLERVSKEWSRLVAIDADLDSDSLRSRHPDRQRMAIAKGRVRASWHYPNPQTAYKGEWRGHIEAISIADVHVPIEMRDAFDPLLVTRDAERRNRYEVTLAYGQRREPWIVEVAVDVQ